MRRLRFLALLLLGNLLGCSRQNARPADTLETIRARHAIPGIAVVALRGDRIVSQEVAGVRKAGGPEPITLNDRFHLGSDTKAMTATLAGLLVEEGKLKWTITLGEVFGDQVPSMAPAWKNVTLDQMLAHRAGFPKKTAPAKDQRDYPTTPVAELRRGFVVEALTHPPEYPPGSNFEYSNTGYIAIGAMIEKVTGATWDDLMQERVFKPLGITTAGFGAPGTPGKVEQPWGHGADMKPIDPGSRDADNPATYGPAGTAHMSIGDWAKFIALHLKGDTANPQRHAILLQADTIAHLHTPIDGQNSGYVGGRGLLSRPWAKGKSARCNGKGDQSRRE